MKLAGDSDVNELNKSVVEKLESALATVSADEISSISSHLDSYGRCLLLLASTQACQKGEPISPVRLPQDFKESLSFETGKPSAEALACKPMRQKAWQLNLYWRIFLMLITKI